MPSDTGANPRQQAVRDAPATRAMKCRRRRLRADELPARTLPASSPLIREHAFISYTRDDAESVDRLDRLLTSAGVPVWRDTASLWPGEDWRAKISQAVTGEAFAFIVCFSGSSLARQSSYQNEEIMLAIEELRLRKIADPWLIPVRFDECQIPEYEIGEGRTIASLHSADLFGVDNERNTARLIGIVLRILSR